MTDQGPYRPVGARKPGFKGKFKKFAGDGERRNFRRAEDGRGKAPQGEKSGRRGSRPFNHDSLKGKVTRREGFSEFQVRLVQSILKAVLEEKKPLDRSYALYFSKVKLPAVEQGFILRSVNGMFRRLSFYAYVAGLRRPSDFERHVNRLIICYCADQGWPIPELDAGDGFDRSKLSVRLGQARNHPVLAQGCPIWLEEIGSKAYGENWEAERKALGSDAARYIRVNTLKTDRDHLASELSTECVVTKSVKGVNTALEVTSNSALFRTKAFKEGLFEQQDAGSQLIAPFLKAGPDLTVVDACAGAGGKTLHLAALMEGRGKLIAMDTESWKLEDLKKRARRAGAHNIETRLIDSTKVIKRLYDKADRVLIDAPCSGTGVLRRTPDSKWRDGRDRLPELIFLQQDLLTRYSRMAKVGGLIVYSTCSILPRENREQIDYFLSHCDGAFELEEDRQLLPSEGFDGFYMARLRRVK